MTWRSNSDPPPIEKVPLPQFKRETYEAVEECIRRSTACLEGLHQCQERLAWLEAMVVKGRE